MPATVYSTVVPLATQVALTAGEEGVIGFVIMLCIFMRDEVFFSQPLSAAAKLVFLRTITKRAETDNPL